jgi:hypothetical protein
VRLAYHLAKLVSESMAFGVSTRKVTVALLVALGLVVVALTVTAQVVAPLALYPFA